MNKSNDKGFYEDEDEELSKMCVSCNFKAAYRKAKGKVSPADIMDRLNKQRSLRIQEQRKRRKTENENKERRRQRMAKIKSICFRILSGTMIVWTVIVLSFWTRSIY
jgi:hypothetical protein